MAKNSVLLAPGEKGQLTIDVAAKRRKTLSESQVSEIRSGFFNGIPCRIIAMRNGVSNSVVKQCVTGVTFRFHDGPVVQPSEFHAMNLSNRKTLDTARKMYGQKPNDSQIKDVQRSLSEAGCHDGGKVSLCNYCTTRKATVPVKVIVENSPTFSVVFCALCYGDFHHSIVRFFN